MIEIII